jgi:two-component system chemotaxis response regulator CheB
MATRDTIVIGASAGGVQALSALVAGLPADLPAALFIVLHIAADAPSLLPTILARESKLPVAHPRNGERISPGHIYVAPPDHHMLIEGPRVKLVHGPKENLHRPSIDTLFRSAARWAGPRVIGVVLTGARDDGTVGMRAIKQQGGVAIVQDPVEATFPSMPTSVMQNITVDYSLPLLKIAPLLGRLAGQSAEDEGVFAVPEQIEIETRIAGQEMESGELIASVERLGKVSKLTCPDCHGALWEIHDAEILRFRCHVGHAFSAEALSDGQSQTMEMALWSAVRALEEQMILARRIVERARKANQGRAATLFGKRAAEAERNSSLLRQLLLGDEKGSIGEPLIQYGDDVSAQPNVLNS